MQTDLTDITVILDRSGSMRSMQADAEGGLNTFIEDQKKAPGRAVFSLIQFDNVSESVHICAPIEEVPPYQLIPRGGTALLDAIGTAIEQTGKRLRELPEEARPGLVTFVIITDGGENDSRRFTKAQIKEMTEHQENKYNWKFIYLGANQDAFAEAGAMGLKSANVANYEPSKARDTYTMVSRKMSAMRGASLANDTVALNMAATFTDEERETIS